MDPVLLLLILILISIGLGSWLVLRWQVYKARRRETINRFALFKEVFFDETITSFRAAWLGQSGYVRAGAELLLLALWAAYLGWDYLNLDSLRIPYGNEFGSAIASNYLWDQFQNCGWCAVWNGSQRGGFPAFADIQGSMLHPLVIFTTLLFGVINGAKITLVISFWLAGVAQWWIARELNFRGIPRIWSAGIAIAGGHLAGRMELGVYGVVLSTASISLVFAALIRMSKANTLHNALLLGVLTAFAIVSGQGYMQIGLIGILPVFLLFYGRQVFRKPDLWNYLLAGGIALMLAAPLLLPLLHFSPNITKFHDLSFRSVQPLSFLVLNLVIDDVPFFYSTLLNKFPYPYLYTLYIGWIPVILFGVAFQNIRDEHKRLIGFMAAGMVMQFLIAGAVFIKPLANVWEPLAGIRHPSQIAGLAIPFLLGISAYGLERILNTKLPDRFFKWTKIINLVVGISLVYGLIVCMRFAREWTWGMQVTPALLADLEGLRTSDLQWVNPPFGEHTYVGYALSMGLKLSPGILTWDWENRIPPAPYLTADRKQPPNPDPLLVYTNAEIVVNRHPEEYYAYVLTHANEEIPCVAKGSGGEIKVTCNTDEAGTLYVQENMWNGWNVWLDGEKANLIEGHRLTTSAPAGGHTFLFRYLPWDVPVGLTIFILGIGLCVFLWFQGREAVDLGQA